MARSTAWLLHLTVAAGLVAVSAHAQRLEPLDQAPAAVGTLAVHAADQPGVPLQNDRGGKRRRVRRGPGMQSARVVTIGSAKDLCRLHRWPSLSAAP